MRTPGFGRFIAFMSLNASVAGLGVLMLPIAVGAMSKGGMSPQVLGVLAFLELGFAAATAMAVSARVARLTPTYLCAVGSALAAAGNLASAIAADHSLMLVLMSARPIVGVGTGLMAAGGLAAVARLANPESAYGYIGMAPCGSALLGFMLAPTLIKISGGAAGIFEFQAVFALLNAMAMFYGYRSLMSYAAASVPGISPQLPSLGSGGAKPAIGFLLYAFCLISMFLLAFGDAAMWAFVEPIGESCGLSLGEVSRLLMVTAIIGCFGPLLAGRLGDRFGLALPITAGQILMIVTAILLTSIRQPVFFGVEINIRVFAILFLYPMYQGLFARIDSTGGVVAASAGVHTIGYAIGPLIAGQMVSIERQEYASLSVLSAAASVCSLLMTYYLLARRREPRTMRVAVQDVTKRSSLSR